MVAGHPRYSLPMKPPPKRLKPRPGPRFMQKSAMRPGYRCPHKSHSRIFHGAKAIEPWRSDPGAKKYAMQFVVQLM